MLSRFKKSMDTPEKIKAKAKDIMLDVVSYRMSGTIDSSSYNNLKEILAELEEDHSFSEDDFDDDICFEPQKVVRALDLVSLVKDTNPREIVVPVRVYAAFIASYCREAIGAVLSDYALKFNRTSANTVTELRELILDSALAYATGLEPNIDKINLVLHTKDVFKIIKPQDEEVSKILIKYIIRNFDMFYIRKVYLEKINVIKVDEDNIKTSIFKVKFYNNSLYILRVLLNLSIKAYGDNAVDIGVANCCRISGVKLRGDLDEVIDSLEKFANRKGYLGLEFIDIAARDISSFHIAMLNNKIDYTLIQATIEMLIEEVDLNLIREIIACIAVLILIKYKHGKLGALEELCILDGIIGKAF